MEKENMFGAMESLEERPTPFFSVVIPAYSSSEFIHEALDSVFSQTYKNFEVIVVNDGSPDVTDLERALEPYLDQIVYITQENRGPGGARNTGIMRARGEFIALLDSDDKWLPHHLISMLERIRKDPTLDLIYADALNFGDPHHAGRTSMETNPSTGVADFEGFIESRCSVIASCAIARREALFEVGLFDETFTHAEDYDLWLRLAYKGKRIDYLRNVHALRRIHDNNLTADIVKSYQGMADVLRKAGREFPLSAEVRQKIKQEIDCCNAHIALELGKENLIARQYERARQELQRANFFFRRPKLTLVLILLRAAPLLVRQFYITSLKS